jgi:hypothetical protein
MERDLGKEREGKGQRDRDRAERQTTKDRKGKI